MNVRAPYGLRAALAAGLLATLLSACAGAPSRYPVPALPVSKLEQLRADALRAVPPQETGEFLDADLVEVVTLDPSLKLDVRYAGPDNFLRAPVYPEARVFLQRPAAEAVVRINRALRAQGYGSAAVRRLPALVCHVDLLGGDAERTAQLRGRPGDRLAPQPRLRDRPEPVRPEDGARGVDAELLMTNSPSARTRTTRVVRRSNARRGTCCARQWRRTALPSTTMSGGTTTIGTGTSTGSATRSSRTWRELVDDRSAPWIRGGTSEPWRMSRQPYWFPAKTYGWGWGLPVTWQGWVVTAATLCCFWVGSRSSNRPGMPPFTPRTQPHFLLSWSASAG